MKNIMTSFVIMLSLSVSVIGQDGWESQHFGSSKTFASVYFIDTNTGWAVGWRCTDTQSIVFKTTDGGTTWIDQKIELVLALMSVYFIDANTGWAVGERCTDPRSTILKTTDGGKTWHHQGTGTPDYMASVYFIDANTGWAVGHSWQSNEYTSHILKTTDGGTNWDNQRSGAKEKLYSVYFIDANNGWAVGWLRDWNGDNQDFGVLLKTTDGGANWSLQTNEPAGILNSVYFIDANTGWAVGRNTILKTTDGGTTWVFQRQPREEWLNSVHFTDANNGWVVGRHTDYDNSGNSLAGYIAALKTSDGGANWSLQNHGEDGGIFKSVFFTDSNTGWAVGTDGQILKTTTGGVTSVEDLLSSEPEIPSQIALSQNYPNPFNPQTTISFELPTPTEVTISIFNLKGQLVTELFSGKKPSGYHSLVWDASNSPTGIYFIKIQAGDFVKIGKASLLK